MNNPIPGTRNPKPGFTLVELLVVITIIGVLIALLIPAISGVMKNAHETRLYGEAQAVGSSMEIFKDEIAGGAYPPNGYVGDSSNPVANQKAVVSDFRRFFNKAFPKHREPNGLILALLGDSVSGNEVDNILDGGLSPAEAVVFWQQRFSSDPRYPISGEGGPAFLVAEGEDLAARKWINKPNDTNLGPRNDSGAFGGNRSIVYNEPFDRNGNGNVDKLRINFWQYFPANSEQPLLYFDASRGLRDIFPTTAILQQTGGQECYPIKQFKTGAGESAQTLNSVRISNEGKYQVLHCGVDGDWGGMKAAFFVDPSITNPTMPFSSNLLLYPDGPYTAELEDNIINFSEQKTLGDSQP